ncbi:hypothetical protein FF1_039730 [Malus domestica]
MEGLKVEVDDGGEGDAIVTLAAIITTEISVVKHLFGSLARRSGSFSISSCCMCHAIKPLFCSMGINPIVHVLDEDPRGKDLERVLMRLLGTSSAESASSMKRRLTVRRLTKPSWFILLGTMAYIAKLCPPVLEFRINLDRIIRICPQPAAITINQIIRSTPSTP